MLDKQIGIDQSRTSMAKARYAVDWQGVCLSRPGIVSKRVTRLSVTIIFLSVASMPEKRRPPQTTQDCQENCRTTLYVYF